MLFTGDFVFVGDIGRPDLLEKAAILKGTQEAGAHQMFASLRKFSVGDRATIGYSLLAQKGYKNILNFSEGMNKWLQEENPVIR